MTNKLNGKDLITIGIFSALYFVINFAFMLAGGFHPLMWILMPGFIAIFAGIPVLLLFSKVQKFGVVLLLGMITGLIYFATGQFTILILISFLIACIGGEIARTITKYKSFAGDAIAYIVFSLGMIGSPIAVWVYKDSFLKQMTEQGMPIEYVSTLTKYISTEILIIMIIAPIIGSIIGLFISKKLFKKHFKKAGII